MNVIVEIKTTFHGSISNAPKNALDFEYFTLLMEESKNNYCEGIPDGFDDLITVDVNDGETKILIAFNKHLTKAFYIFPEDGESVEEMMAGRTFECTRELSVSRMGLGPEETSFLENEPCDVWTHIWMSDPMAAGVLRFQLPAKKLTENITVDFEAGDIYQKECMNGFVYEMVIRDGVLLLDTTGKFITVDTSKAVIDALAITSYPDKGLVGVPSNLTDFIFA